MNDDAKRNGCCSCHSHPPCGWCESLDEEEADAINAGGRDMLEQLWATRDRADDTEEST